MQQPELSEMADGSENMCSPLENFWVLLYKVKCMSVDRLFYSIPRYLPKRKICPQEDLSKNVYSKFVYCVSRGSLTTQGMSQEIVGAGGQAGDPEKSQHFSREPKGCLDT